jgi:DNA-binding NtrC family response regulator
VNKISNALIGAKSAVLVVEDEAVIRMLLVDALEDAGFSVIEAEGADPAMVELINHPEIGVVITDIRMPGSVDGLGLAAWMRKNRPDVPIIITSGFSTSPDAAAINPAIVRIVAKPYRSCYVLACLHEIGMQPSGPASLGVA